MFTLALNLIQYIMNNPVFLFISRIFSCAKRNYVVKTCTGKYFYVGISLLAFLICSKSLTAQSSGDYRSNATTMNWNAAASWQKFNGTSWATSTDYPGQNTCSACTVTIQNGNTVTLNISPANSIGALVVGGGANGTLTLGTFTLTVTGNLTVNTGATLTLATATFSVGGTSAIAGTVTDASNTGVNTFTGLVTKTAGTWTSTAVTAAANMIFSSGFTNTAGTFSGGAATIGDNQTLTGTVNMSFTGGLTVLGNGDLNVAGTTGAGVTFGGTSINYSIRNLNLTGLLIVSTTGNLTVTGVTNITGTGAFNDNNNAGVTSFTGLVTHNSTGTWTSTTVATASNMVFSAGFKNTAGTFNGGAATISDNQTLTGTVNMSFSSGLTVLGNGDLTIAGTATTGATFGGTAINYTVRNLTLTGRLVASTTGNLTVTGTTNITGTGAFVDNNNAGVTSFTGLVTHNSTGAWTSTTVSTAANMIFHAGFTNTAGSFSAGGATIDDNQTLNGGIVMVFNSPVTINGTGNITFTGTGGVRLAGTSINYTIPGNLTLTGTLLVSTTGNFTVNGTTSITGAGDFTDNNNTGISTFTGLVTHNSTGRWLTTSVTTASNLVLTAGFTNTAGTFSAGGATIGDNKTLTGTVTMSFTRGITVLGNGDITIAGTSTTGVTFGGAAINYTIRNLTVTGLLTVSTTGNLTVNGTTTISSTGAFLDNNGTGTTSFAGLVTVGSSSTFTATSTTTIGRLTFNGGIVHDNTASLSFYAGTIRTTATQTWSGLGSITTTGVIDVNTGTLTNNISGTVTCGGTLTGTTWVQGTNTYLALGSTTPASITTLTSTASGNTIEYKSAGSATMRGQTYHHLIISGSGNKVIPTSDITVNGNLTINTGVLSNTTNNKNIILSGNWINNVATGGFTAGTGTVTFSGASAQTLGGTGVTTFYKLTLNNAAGINQTSSSTITNVLTLTSGIITTGSSTVIISSTGSISRTSGHINGNEQRNVATGTNVARTFDVGDASNYTPVTLTFATVSTAGNVTVKSTAGDHSLLVSSYLDGNLSINRNWTISNSATVFTNYTAVFNFIAGDKDASTNTSNLIVGRYSSSWSYPSVGTKTSTSTQVTGLTAFGDFALAEQLPCVTPTLVITNPPPFCSPATANLTAASVTAGSTAGLTYTYWTNAAATITLPSPAAVGTGGTYYIKGTVSLGGCSDVKPVVVTRANPTGIISGTATICATTSAALSIDVTGTGSWSGTLSNGASFSGSVSPLSVSVTPSSNTTYTISTLSDASCTAQAGDKTGSAVITIAALPTTANAGADQSVCATSTTLAANTPVTGTGSWSIISGTGGSFSSATNPSATFTGTTGQTYTLRWSITNSPCTVSTDDVVVSFTSGVWTGSVSSDWNNAANWCGGILPSGTIDLIITAGLPNYPAISDIVTINDLSVAAGAYIYVTNNGVLTIRGNNDNNGTISNDGAIVLSGTSQQTFPGANATVAAMRDLEIDNGNGVDIDKSFSITGTLTPTSGVINLNDKKITLVSNASGTARVAGVVDGTFDYSGGGKFVVQRYVPARRAWRLMTSPLTSTNTIYDSWQNGGVYTPGAGTFITGAGVSNGFDVDGNPSLKEYDGGAQALVASAGTNTGVSPGVSGSADNKGYFIFVRGDRNPANLSTTNSNATTLSSEGQLQTGAQTFSANTSAGRYTLIGNPYASPIDFNTVTRNNLVKRFYVWDPSLNTVGGYVTMDDIDNDGVYTKSVTSSQTNELLSHQAFFVETAANGAASIQINESDKSDGTSYVVSRPAKPLAEKQKLQISLFLLNSDNSTVLADGVTAEFNDAYSTAVTFEDAMKFTNINESFSLARNEKLLSVERRPALNFSDTLFLNLAKTKQRNYQLHINPSNLDIAGLAAAVRDNFTGIETTLKLDEESIIGFSVTSDPASSATDRFKILFRPSGTVAVNFTSISAKEQNKNVVVEWETANEAGTVKYEVEKSVSGTAFVKIASLEPTPGNAAAKHYTWLDVNASGGDNFYRIKSIDRNGQAKYSQVVKLVIGNMKNEITAYPNPVKNNVLNISFSNKPVGSYQVQLINNNGQSVYRTSIVVLSANMVKSVTVPSSLPKGAYRLKIETQGALPVYKQVLIQ